MTKASRAKAPSYLKFKALILAPLPPSAEPVDHPAYLRVVRSDMKDRWFDGLTFVNLARHERDAWWGRRSIAMRTQSYVEEAKRQWEAANRAYWHACDAQMRIPAPTKDALKWKRDTRKFGGGSPDWEAAIAADEARLAGPMDLAPKSRGKVAGKGEAK